MNKHRIAALAAVAALAVAPMARASSFDFSGIYIGVHSGGIENEIDFDGGGGSLDEDGLFGGFQAGYNVINGNLMYGVEADLSISDSNMRGICPYNAALNCDIEASPFMTVRPRIGYVTGDWLFYATGGVAAAMISVDAVDGGGNKIDSADFNEVGFTLGVGLEHMLGSTVGVKAEYRYYRFDDIDFDSKSVDPTPDADLDMHTFMLGLNWHF